MSEERKETSYKHKKEHNGELGEVGFDKLSKVDINQQTPKDKKALKEITEKTTDNL